MLEGCAARAARAARAGLATRELSDVMKIQAQIIGSLIRKAAVDLSLDFHHVGQLSNHRLANSEGSSGSFSSSSSNPGIGSEGARCAASIEAKAHLCVDALDPAAVHVCWFVLLSPQVASLGRVAGSDMTWPTP